MEVTAYKAEIQEIFSSIREFSFQEKKASTIHDDRPDRVLNAIRGLEEELVEKSQRINEINEQVEKLTWLNGVDEDDLMLINDLISSLKDLYSSFVRQLDVLESFSGRREKEDKIFDFKERISEMRESYEDLESVFFFLPQMPGFPETTEKISLL